LSDLGRWEPRSPSEVAAVLRGADAPWWIAGGWALDLFLGARQRPHEDIDVLVLRRDAPTFKAHLRDWDTYLAGGGKLWPWTADVPGDVTDVWVRERDSRPWRFQLMLNPADADHWVFKRDTSIRLSLTKIGERVHDLSILRPEIQLLHKATGSIGIRPKDEADFRVVLPALDDARRSWLSTALARISPAHPWLGALRANLD
jgi:hypothetical protein